MPTKTKKKTEPKTTIRNPFGDIVDMFRDYVRPSDYKLPFDVLVAVCGTINSPGPRDPRWEFALDMGMPKIEKVLKHEPIGKGPHYFMFPDRWMVPIESARFVSALSKNPDAASFDRVYIVTHAPYIVGDCRREQVRLVTNAQPKSKMSQEELLTAMG